MSGTTSISPFQTNFPVASLVWEMKLVGVEEEHSLREGSSRQQAGSVFPPLYRERERNKSNVIDNFFCYFHSNNLEYIKICHALKFFIGEHTDNSSNM